MKKRSVRLISVICALALVLLLCPMGAAASHGMVGNTGGPLPAKNAKQAIAYVGEIHSLYEDLSLNHRRELHVLTHWPQGKVREETTEDLVLLAYCMQTVYQSVSGVDLGWKEDALRSQSGGELAEKIVYASQQLFQGFDPATGKPRQNSGFRELTMFNLNQLYYWGPRGITRGENIKNSGYTEFPEGYDENGQPLRWAGSLFSQEGALTLQAGPLVTCLTVGFLSGMAVMWAIQRRKKKEMAG